VLDDRGRGQIGVGVVQVLHEFEGGRRVEQVVVREGLAAQEFRPDHARAAEIGIAVDRRPLVRVLAVA